MLMQGRRGVDMRRVRVPFRSRWARMLVIVVGTVPAVAWGLTLGLLQMAVGLVWTVYQVHAINWPNDEEKK